MAKFLFAKLVNNDYLYRRKALKVNQYLVEIVRCLLNVEQNPYHIAGGTAKLMRSVKVVL